MRHGREEDQPLQGEVEDVVVPVVLARLPLGDGLEERGHLRPDGLLEDCSDVLGQLGDLLGAAGRVDFLEDGVQLAAGLLAFAEAKPDVLGMSSTNTYVILNEYQSLL